MRFAVPIAACAFLFGAPAMAQTRLTDQTVMGWKRICSYEDLRATPAGARNRPAYTLEVGRGEPCPFRYRLPTAAERPRRVPARPPASARALPTPTP